LEGEGDHIVVPYVCDVEVLSVFRRAVRLLQAEEARVRQALDLYLDLPLRRFKHDALLVRAFAYRDNFTAYGAMYVVLAEGLGAPLVTADLRLARATRAWTDVTVVEV
jgi:predicted nucleic acid-binding protein